MAENPASDEAEHGISEIFSLPPNLPPLSELPPSLLPPPPGRYSQLPKLKWG